MRGNLVAHLTTGLVLQQCALDIMQLIYEMEYLALLQPPDPQRTQDLNRRYLEPVAYLRTQASAEAWWRHREAPRLVARSLCEAGFCVLDSFLPESTAQALLDGALASRPGMGRGVHGKGEDAVARNVDDERRGDLVRFVEDPAGLPGYEVLTRAVDELVCSLRDCESVSERLRCVDFANCAQVSIYPGGASRYTRHADNSLGTDGRRLTAILYLNKAWAPSHGGKLRLFEPNLVETKIDLEPIWNRLVLFWSTAEVPHEVLSCYRDRIAISIWYLCGRECLSNEERLPLLFDEQQLRVITGEPRRQVIMKGADTEDQRKLLAAMPFDSTDRFAHLARKRSELAEAFGWQLGASASPLGMEDASRVVRRDVDADDHWFWDGRDPVIVTSSMPHLSGQLVLDFMGVLTRSSGASAVDIEFQRTGESNSRQMPLHVAMQELDCSSPGDARFVASAAALEGPLLTRFLEPPVRCAPGRVEALSAGQRAGRGRNLILSGRSAVTPLLRAPADSCCWQALVLGESRYRLFPPETPPAALHPWDPGDALALKGPAAACEGTQRMGEVLLIPSGWWYQALSEDKSLRIAGQWDLSLPIAQTAVQIAADQPGHIRLDSRGSSASLHLEELSFGTRELRVPLRRGGLPVILLEAASSEEATACYKAVGDKDPFGTKLWPAAVVCAELVLAESVAGRSVLELGCGTGLVSIAAAMDGAAAVTATDRNAMTLCLASAAARLNNLVIHTTVFDVCSEFALPSPREDVVEGARTATRGLAFQRHFDIVAFSDVLYWEAESIAFGRRAAEALLAGSTVVVADPGRRRNDFANALRGRLAEDGWDVAVEEACVDMSCPSDILQAQISPEVRTASEMFTGKPFSLVLRPDSLTPLLSQTLLESTGVACERVE